MKRYGKGFSATNLKYFRTFYLAYPEWLSNIRHPLGDELMETGKGFHPNLSWSHYRTLMPGEKHRSIQRMKTDNQV